MKFLLVQLLSKHANNLTSANIGLHIVYKSILSSGHSCDIVHFDDNIANVYKYDYIAFNCLYVGHSLNLVPFLLSHNINPKASERRCSPKLMIGGPGVISPDLFRNIVDYCHVGHIPDNFFKSFFSDEIYSNNYSLLEHPIFFSNKAVIEISRGCQFNCLFCHYSKSNDKFFYLPFNDVIRQIDQCKSAGINKINFFSANFAGIPYLSELLKYCIDNKVRVLNSDFAILSLTDEKLKLLRNAGVSQLRLGIESPFEKIRFSQNKPISDTKLLDILTSASSLFYNFHLYFIHQLPKEKYSYLYFLHLQYILDAIRSDRSKKHIVTFSFTNYLPSPIIQKTSISPINFSVKSGFVASYYAFLNKNEYLSNERFFTLLELLKNGSSFQQLQVGTGFNAYMSAFYLTQYQSNDDSILLKLPNYKYIRRFKPGTYQALQSLS